MKNKKGIKCTVQLESQNQIQSKHNVLKHYTYSETNPPPKLKVF